MENLTFYDFIKNYNYYNFRKCRAYINGVLYNGYLYKIDAPTKGGLKPEKILLRMVQEFEKIAVSAPSI